LSKLGRLEKGFNSQPLIFLLTKQNENVRALAMKNLAKLEDVSLLSFFVVSARKDSSTLVRREAVSAIGRLRNPQTIPFLIEMLKDPDPKVVMQAIRGLLVFKANKDIQNELKRLLNHPNEVIKEIVNKEINGLKCSNQKDHIKSPDFLKNVVVHGDVLEVLKYVPDESIHLTFTSPPYYNARDYSIYQSYEKYLTFLETVFKEVYRITKEGRFFILNTSPIIIPRVSRQHSSKRYPIPYDIHPLLVKMGWEFIDDIIWVKPEASVKNRNAGFLQHRKPLGYKPNAVTEMLMVYRKKTDKLIDWNMEQYPLEIIKRSKVTEDYETMNIWRIDPAFDKVHSAVFPIELCNRIIKFYSYIGDLIFDPFAGSGTLGKSAINLERYFFMTEIDEKYVNRIKEVLSESPLLFSKKLKIPEVISLDEFIQKAKLYDTNRIGN
ncbi:MAG: DNA methyltransferase, partial [Candidatus Poribacteria bacterium]